MIIALLLKLLLAKTVSIGTRKKNIASNYLIQWGGQKMNVIQCVQVQTSFVRMEKGKNVESELTWIPKDEK